MAKIRLAGGQYLAREDGTPGRWGSALKMRAERALVLSAELRARGIQAEAIQDTGGESLEPPATAAAPTLYAPVVWRGITPKLAAQNTYVHSFRAPGGDGAIQTVSGKSPDDVIRKIKDLAGWNEDTKSVDKYEGHPIYTAYLNSLPPESGLSGPPAITQPVVPRQNNPNGRVLRPGSASHIAADLPERRDTSAPVVREDLISWERTVSVAALKERYAKDRDFAFWYDSQNQVKQ